MNQAFGDSFVVWFTVAAVIGVVLLVAGSIVLFVSFRKRDPGLAEDERNEPRS